MDVGQAITEAMREQRGRDLWLMFIKHDPRRRVRYSPGQLRTIHAANVVRVDQAAVTERLIAKANQLPNLHHRS